MDGKGHQDLLANIRNRVQNSTYCMLLFLLWSDKVYFSMFFYLPKQTEGS